MKFKTARNKKRKKNDSLLLKYSDYLNDLLNEGRSIEESIKIISSKISKNNDKIFISSIFKKMRENYENRYDNFNDVEYYMDIFSKK